jgi:DNA modification methylase
MRLAEAIVKRRIDQLAPYASNSRTHSAQQIAQIAASIREFGFTNPVLIDGEGTIVAGHARVLAAKELGLKQVPTIDIGYLSETQRQAYVIADNKLAENAGWDQEMLRLELGDLRDAGFDLRLAGFSELELVSFWAEQGRTDPDEAPELPAIPVTAPGDVWLLGRHRLVCGDSTSADTVAKALNGAAPHLMVTDPPYGVEYEAGWRNAAMPQKNNPKRWKDGSGRATGAAMNDDRADWREAWMLFPGDVAYIWHAGNRAQIVAASLTECGLEIRAQIIWAKHQLVIGRGHYHPQHEPCWYAVRKGKTGHWAGDRKQTTLWEIDKPKKSETGHSTQKPVECMRRPIENNSSPGQAVYDPFLGSGTTIIAAEMTSRACHAIELSPNYIDVAVLRWQAFAGAEATLEGDGRSFAAVAEQRSK